MKVPSFVIENTIIKAFGRELAKLRRHPEYAWQLAWWGAATDDATFAKHDAIKEMAFSIYGVADELRLKSMLPPMGAIPTDPEIAAHWIDHGPTLQ
jgi:hypothetical protein